jgi:MarR family transcriptional repressor of emrRAB
MQAMQTSGRRERDANILGAASLAITDALLDGIADADGHGPSEAAALVHLRLRPAENIDFLARVIGLSHPAAVRVVDRLVSEGLAERREGRDRRARSLVLTPTGRRAADRALAGRAEALEAALDPLSARERRELTALLEKLLDSLTEDRWGARHICRLCDYPVCSRPACPVDRAATLQEVAA